MKKKSLPSGGSDGVRQARQVLAALSACLESLAERGDMTEAERLAKDLAEELQVPETALSPLLERFRGSVENDRAGLAECLRRAAEESECEFQCRLPYVRFGCVDLREGVQGRWTLSVLGPVRRGSNVARFSTCTALYRAH